MHTLLELCFSLLVAPQTTPDPPAPRGLLGVAESEARRTERLLRDRVMELLKKYVLAKDTAADGGGSYIEAIVRHGADVHPLLIELMRSVGNGTVDAAWAGPIARALAAAFDRTKNVAILKSMREIAGSGQPAVRAGVLEGLEALDHPIVVEIVQPLMQDPDPAVRKQVVRVLGRQKSGAATVGGLLRPLLEEEGAPWPDTLDALLNLGDKGGVEAAQTYLTKSAEPAVLGASIRYLAELGGKSSLPALKGLFTHGPANVTDALLKRAVDAVQRIGLRDVDARKGAEDILVEVFKRHTSWGVRDYAKWQLGPYQNAEALKELESKTLDLIRANDKAGRGGNADLYIELAETRIQFEEYAKAIDALNKADNEDERGLRVASIEPARAVALCGQGKFAAAEKILRNLPMEDRQTLLERYPVLRKMSGDPKYRDVFQDR